MLDTFVHVTFNDLYDLEAKIDEQTAAVMLEVIQGEGGVVVGDPSFITGVEKLCEDHDVLLIVDRSEEHTSELQSRGHLVCRLLLEKKKKILKNCGEHM